VSARVEGVEPSVRRSLWVEPEWPRIFLERLGEAERLAEEAERRERLRRRWRENKRRWRTAA
jgi:hypothetical protein